MNRKPSNVLFVLYLAIWGSYCGLEINTFVENTPSFHLSALLIFIINVVFILLIPPLLYWLCMQISRQWKKYLMPAVFILNSIYVHLAILLAIYKSERDAEFNFNYFWYNISVAWSVLWKLFAPWLVVIFLSLIVFAFLQPLIFDPALRILKKFQKFSWKGSLALGLVIAACVLCQCLTIATVRTSAAGFLYASFFSDYRLRNEYSRLYEKHVSELTGELDGIESGDASRLGDMIIMVDQESLNGLLVGPDVTPQLLRAAKNGILFDELYGNSIQSERGFECILCGIPPSVRGVLVEEYPIEDVEKINCLPRLFKTLGYQPVVFYGGRNPNPREMNLFKAIGFEQILAGDIMQPDDVMYEWGYREDIWFTRVNDYIVKHFGAGKYFIFITASATNHTPFKVLDPRFHDKVPYPNPKKFEEKLANTTYVQDAYFGHLYDLYRKNYSDRATLIAVSDHSWPFPLHKHNIHNERGAFEENFRIAMLVIPPSNSREFAVGTTVTQRFSQMDILPSLLELANVRQNYWLGESFAPWLLADPNRARTEPQKLKVSIQPYSGGFIAVHRYPQKYLFDILERNVKIYDLSNDPGETSPTIHATDEYVSLIRDFFKTHQ